MFLERFNNKTIQMSPFCKTLKDFRQCEVRRQSQGRVVVISTYLSYTENGSAILPHDVAIAGFARFHSSIMAKDA